MKEKPLEPTNISIVDEDDMREIINAAGLKVCERLYALMRPEVRGKVEWYSFRDMFLRGEADVHKRLAASGERVVGHYSSLNDTCYALFPVDLARSSSKSIYLSSILSHENVHRCLDNKRKKRWSEDEAARLSICTGEEEALCARVSDSFTTWVFSPTNLASWDWKDVKKAALKPAFDRLADKSRIQALLDKEVPFYEKMALSYLGATQI